MTSSPRHCPVCSHALPDAPADAALHVNAHLDAHEDAASRTVAEELHRRDRPRPPSPPPPPPPAAQPDVHLGPAERMMREVEANDAALASQLAALEAGAAASPSLVGSLGDSAERFYPNVLAKVFPLYDALENVLRKKVHVCSKLDLFSSNVAGLGWDCGYRNIQALFSALLYDPDAAHRLRDAGVTEVPSVPEIAGRIEDAWKRGYDPEGAASFAGALLDKEVWIGATEVFVLLRSMEFPAFVKDFETPTDADKRTMFAWVFDHFHQWCNRSSCSVHRRSLLGSKKHTLVPPLFCQWQGHSVTIIGAEKTKSGEIVLIILDPSRGFFLSLVENRAPRLPLVQRTIDHPQFAQPRFQLVSLPPGKSSSSVNIREVRRGFLNGLRLGGPS